MIYILSVFSYIAIAYYFSEYIPAEHNDALTLAILAGLILFALVPWLGGLNHAKKTGLVCQACDGGLLGNPGQIAMTTDCCPHCGKFPFERRSLA